MNYLPAAQAPEFLRVVVDFAAEVLARETSLDEATAIEIGQKIALRIAETYRGWYFRIPAGTWNRGSLNCFELHKRDLQIYREFNGSNLVEVMAKYGLSKTRLYQIVHAVRDRLKAKPPT